MIEVLKTALEALEEIHVGNMTPMAETNWNKAITSLRQAIQEAEKQEPFGYFQYCFRLDAWVQNRQSDKGQRFYTSPLQLQPLTDEQIVDAVREADLDWHKGWTLDDEAPNRFTTFARAIEAAHGIKGE
jgi:hypothetical protein